MPKKNKRPESGANWMDTYGDMVTLLLCFFVLLYSMSNIDQIKYQALVRSFNPDAIITPTETSGENGFVAESQDQESIEASIDQLYQELIGYAAQQDATKDITVTRGDGYIFLSMNNTVFFDGDSYTLRPDGAHILDDLATLFGKVSSSIDEIRIMGHTAQATPNDPNDPSVDRFLSSNRSVTVLLYLQNKNIIDPARLVSLGYGQWRPISDNATSAERAKNRRVEFVISGKNVENSMSDSITQYYSMRQTPQPPSSQNPNPAAIPTGTNP